MNKPPVCNKRYKIRLLLVVAIGVGSCFFVDAYTKLGFARFRVTSNGHPAIRGCEYLLQYGSYFYIIPFTLLVAGLLSLGRAKEYIVYESIIAAGWIFAILWFGTCLILWQSQSVPYP